MLVEGCGPRLWLMGGLPPGWKQCGPQGGGAAGADYDFELSVTTLNRWIAIAERNEFGRARERWSWPGAEEAQPPAGA